MGFEPKWTPPPWKATRRSRGSYASEFLVSGPKGIVCSLKTDQLDPEGPSRGEGQATAALIAAAPELYDALVMILPLAERYLARAPADPDNAKLETARAAIVKATKA